MFIIHQAPLCRRVSLLRGVGFRPVSGVSPKATFQPHTVQMFSPKSKRSRTTDVGSQTAAAITQSPLKPKRTVTRSFPLTSITARIQCRIRMRDAKRGFADRISGSVSKWCLLHPLRRWPNGGTCFASFMRTAGISPPVAPMLNFSRIVLIHNRKPVGRRD